MPKAKKRVLVFKREGVQQEEKVVKESRKLDREEINAWSWATQLGLEISLPIAFGILTGSALDKRLGTQPRLTLSLLVFGIVVSFYILFKKTQSVR